MAEIMTTEIRIGSRTVTCERSLATKLGWESFADGGRWMTAVWAGGDPEEALAIALSEGLTGEDAVLRAIAIKSIKSGHRSTRDQDKMRLDAAQAEEKAAGMRLAAEREVTRRHERANRG